MNEDATLNAHYSQVSVGPTIDGASVDYSDHVGLRFCTRPMRSEV